MRKALLAPPLLFLLVFFAWPLARTLQAGYDADAWGWVLGHPYVRSRLGVAVLQAVASAALTLALALPLAWFYHARRVPLGRLHLAIHAAPFILPVFVVVFGLQALLGRDSWLERLTGLDALAALGPLGAVVLAHAYYNYGFAARLLHATLERRPHRLEEAARALGASPEQALARVTLPLLLPSMLAVALLAFLFAFSSFGVVLFLGEGRVSTPETLVYENLAGGFPDYARAGALGTLQVGLGLVFLWTYLRLTARTTRLPRDPARTPAPARPRERAAAWLLVGLALLPAMAVLAGGFRLRGSWSLEPWRALLEPGGVGGFDLGHATALSLLYAACAATASLMLTALLAYGLRALGGRARRAVEAAAALPLGTSSLLLGLGYLLAFGAGAWLDLRGTFLVVVVAHTSVAFPFTARVLLPAFEQLDPRLDEAAALLGASPREVVRRVHAPLMRAPVLAALGLAGAVSLGDFGASLLLMRPDTMGLGVWIARLGGPGSFDPLLRAESTALAGLLMVLAVACYVMVERAGARWGER